MPPQRRDPRYRLRDGSAFLELADPSGEAGRVRGAVRRISAAGLAFECDGFWRDVAPGTALVDTVLRVGDCSLRGTVLVLNVTELGPERAELGGVFHAESPVVEDRLMTLLAGIEAAAPDRSGAPE
jgi:hypothetical protein